MGLPVLAILEVGRQLIDKLIPDPSKKAEAQFKLLELQQAGFFKELEADLQVRLGQIEVNKAEATAGAFRGGWRPAVGWICASGLAYTYLLRPLLAWASTIWHVPAPPALDLVDLMTLLAGMLGLGTLRTVEKRTGLP